MSSSLFHSHRVSQVAKVFFTLLLPTLAFTQIPSTPTPSTPTVSKFDLPMSDIKIVTPATGRVSAIDMQTARIEPEIVTVQRGDRVVSLLAENGIRQDGQALALIYDLNPQVEDIRQIAAGQKLKLPEIEGSDSLEFALRNGYRVELLRNFAVMQVVETRAQQVQQLESTLVGMTADRFATPRDKTEITGLLDETRKAMDAIKSPDKAVSLKVFQQASAEVAFILKNVSAAVESERAISVVELAQAKESAENLQALGEEIKAGGSGLVRTTIKTINARTGEPVGQLKVFYVPTADRNQRHECSQLSSPVTEAIARGEYIFWAMRGNEKVSDDKERTIRKNTRDISLDIPIIR